MKDGSVMSSISVAPGYGEDNIAAVYSQETRSPTLLALTWSPFFLATIMFIIKVMIKRRHGSLSWASDWFLFSSLVRMNSNNYSKQSLICNLHRYARSVYWFSMSQPQSVRTTVLESILLFFVRPMFLNLVSGLT